VILLPGPGKFDALAIAERIRCRVAATTVSVASPDTQSQFVGVTASIGVTVPIPMTARHSAATGSREQGTVRSESRRAQPSGGLRSRESPRNQAIVIASSFSRR
jgi:GGDEF domain-containing protein